MRRQTIGPWSRPKKFSTQCARKFNRALRLPTAHFFSNTPNKWRKQNQVGQISDPLRGPLVGGFLADGRTTPTATRMEGLLAALAFLPREQTSLARFDRNNRALGVRIFASLANSLRRFAWRRADGGFLARGPSGCGRGAHRLRPTRPQRLAAISRSWLAGGLTDLLK